LFEGTNAFSTLSEILSDILRDVSLQKVYLMVDALDECESDLDKLLKLVITEKEFDPASKVKWLVTSRNRPDIEEYLQPNDSLLKISLELKESQLTHAINKYIDFKVLQLKELQDYDDELEKEVRGHLRDNAEGTFLWVALICKELEKMQL